MRHKWRHPILILAALTVMVTGGTIAAQNASQTSQAMVNIIAPELFRVDDSGNEENIRFPTLFSVGETLRTDASGQVLLTWFYDGTETMLGPNTTITLDAFEGEPAGDFYLETELSAGHIAAGLGDVAAASPGEWRIRTPAFMLRPISGQFELIVLTDGTTRLIVTDGTVEILSEGDQPAVVQEGEFVVSDNGAAESRALTDNGITTNLVGACSATANTNLNVRLAPNEDSRRLDGLKTGDQVWVRGITEGSLWLQVYIQTDPDDPETQNYGWVYGPATTIAQNACEDVIRPALDAQIYGGAGMLADSGITAESVSSREVGEGN